MDIELVNATFPDTVRPVRQRIWQILSLLEKDARLSLTALSRRLGIPVTTVHDTMRCIRERLTIGAVCTPIPGKTPQPAFRCPTCRSKNTAPELLYNEVTGRTKVMGLPCHDCHSQARRGQLSLSLLQAVEA